MTKSETKSEETFRGDPRPVFKEIYTKLGIAIKENPTNVFKTTAFGLESNKDVIEARSKLLDGQGFFIPFIELVKNSPKKARPAIIRAHIKDQGFSGVISTKNAEGLDALTQAIKLVSPAEAAPLMKHILANVNVSYALRKLTPTALMYLTEMFITTEDKSKLNLFVNILTNRNTQTSFVEPPHPEKSAYDRILDLAKEVPELQLITPRDIKNGDETINFPSREGYADPDMVIMPSGDLIVFIFNQAAKDEIAPKETMILSENFYGTLSELDALRSGTKNKDDLDRLNYISLFAHDFATHAPRHTRAKILGTLAAEPIIEKDDSGSGRKGILTERKIPPINLGAANFQEMCARLDRLTPHP